MTVSKKVDFPCFLRRLKSPLVPSFSYIYPGPPPLNFVFYACIYVLSDGGYGEGRGWEVWAGRQLPGGAEVPSLGSDPAEEGGAGGDLGGPGGGHTIQRGGVITRNRTS